MSHNTIAIVNSVGEPTTLSPIQMDVVRTIMVNWLTHLFNKPVATSTVYSNEEIELVLLMMPSAAVIKGMTTVHGKHYCFSAASIHDEDLYVLY